MSFTENYLKLRAQRERSDANNAGGDMPPASKSDDSPESNGGTFTSRYLKLREQRQNMTIAERANAKVQGFLNKQAEQYRTAGSFLRNAGTVPGVKTSGGYYSRPELGVQSERLHGNITALEPALTAKRTALDTAQSSVAQAENDLKVMQGYLQQAKDAYDADPTAENATYFNQLVGAYNLAYDAYLSTFGAYSEAYDAYKPYEDQLVDALAAYQLYATQQQSAFDDWRGTIRDAETIQGEIDTVDQQLRDLDEAEKKAAWASIPLEERLPAYLTGEKNTEVYGPDYAPGVIARNPLVTPETKSPEWQRLEALQKLLQEEHDWSMYYHYADMMQAPDFAKNSRYQTTANGKEPVLHAMSGRYTETGFDDLIYDYINKNEDAIGKVNVNGIADNTRILGLDQEFLQQMTEEEIAIFNYLYKTQGRNAAYDYTKYLASELNYRRRKEEEAYWAKYAEESPAMATAFSVLTSPLKSLSYLGQFADYSADGRIDQNAAYNKFSHLNSDIRGEVAKTIEESGKWGKLGSFGYQTAVSMADFLFNSALTGNNQALTLTIMGSGAAADTVMSAKDRGLSDGQAFALGTIAGILEGGIEALNMDTVFKPNALKDGVIRYILKNATAEGAEEVATDIGNLVFDVLIAADQNVLQASIDNYMKQGLTENEAVARAFADQALQMASDFGGGFLSGSILSGTNAGIHVNYTNQMGSELGELNLDDEDIQTFIETGLESDPETALYKLATEMQAKIEAGETLSNYDLARLYQANMQAIQEEAAEDLSGDSQTDAVAGEVTDPGGLSLPSVENDTQAPGFVTQNTQNDTQTQVNDTVLPAGVPLSIADQLRRERAMNGGTQYENTHKQAPGPATAKPAGELYVPDRAGISDGSAERNAGAGTAEQAGVLASSTRSGSAGRTAFASRAAIDRQSRAKSLRLEKVSSLYLGLQNGTEARNIQVMPQEYWDNEMSELADRIYNETGKGVTYVMGRIQIRGTGGTVGYARGVITGDRIIVQADHLRIPMEQIADHEAYHAKADFTDGRLNDEIRRHIVETFSEEQYRAVLETYVKQLRCVYNLTEAKTVEEYEETLDIIEEEIFADAYAGINAFGAGADQFMGAVNEKMDQLYMGKIRNQNNGAAEPTGPPERFSISEIDGTETDYGEGVILDTDIFNGVKTRDWGKVLSKFVYENLAGTEITTYTESGQPEVIQFAKKNERVMKDGSKSPRKAIDELARYRGDNIRALATVHLSEMLQTSKFEKTTDEHSHQWLDENGWELRTVFIADKTGRVYRATLNIANARDGRRILYAINQIRHIDNRKKASVQAQVPSTVSGAARTKSHDASEATIPDSKKKVKERFSYAGENAHTADLDALARAKEMRSAGVADETIRQQTGWHTGMDGKWRWEIDDSGMEYSGRGDLGLRERRPEYARYRELLDKANRHALELSDEALTPEEAAELQKLKNIWGGTFRKAGRITEDALPTELLSDYVKHDALFEAYPQLRKTQLRFADLPEGARGQYDPEQDIITLSNKLRGKPQDTLIHEIQHVIQKAEGFAQGSSPEFWDGQLVVPPEYGSEIQKAEDTVKKVEAEFHQEWPDDINLNLVKQYIELDNQLWGDGTDPIAMQELADQMDQIEQLATQSGWGNLFNDYYYAVSELQMAKERAKLHRRTSIDLYRNTAGEIEARDVTARRKLDQEGRKITPPNLGDANTVFAERSSIAGDFAGWTADGNEVYKTSAATLGMSVSSRIAKFKQDYTNNFQGRTAKIVRNGHTYYAQFSRDSSEFGKLTYEGNAKGSRSSSSGYKAKIRLLADGSIFEIVEDSTYRDTAKEIGGKNSTHKNAKYWDYYVKTVVVDGKAYDVLISVRLDDASGNWTSKERYVYSIRFRDNKTAATSIASPATSKVLHQDDVAANLILSDADSTVKEDFTKGEPLRNRRQTNRYSVEDSGQDPAQQQPAAPKKKIRPVAESRPLIAKKDLRSTVLNLFSIPNGQRAEVGTMIDSYADRLIKNGSLTEDDRKAFFDRMYDAGVMVMPAEEYSAFARSHIADGRIYVRDSVKADFGDDWADIRRRAFAAGVYLVNDRSASGIDQWNATLSAEDMLPGLFDSEETDERTILERILQVAEEGKDEHLSLAEYTRRLSQQEGISEDEFLDNMERQLDWALRTFAEKARLEVHLRDRTGVKIAQEREKGAERMTKQRAKEAQRRADERQARKDSARRAKERRELRELQQRTLKQLQWLSRNRNRAPEELKATWDEVLGDIDLYAISAADEMRWSDKHNATWKDLAQMYKDAMKNDPNFLPSKELERIVTRLDATKIADMDLGALQDLYKAAIGLRTEFYNRNNVINDEMQRLFAEVYTDAKREIESAPGGFTGGVADKFLNLDQLTPMNVLQRMAGWDPDGAFYSMAKQLERGERDMRAYSVKAQKMLQDFLTEHEDWVKKADGQGKDAIWYEVEVPQLLELGMGDKPIFGPTVKVYMTPAQKVHMYLESKNLDNLRHMTGGRTFVNKDLYSRGKRQEALSQGRTIELAPETVRKLVSDLTPEEMELAQILDRYYNTFATQEINKVSNILYGYDKAMGKNYAPIYTNRNYTKTEFGVFDTTAEGVGNLKGRQYAVNPSYNISAFDAFERHVDQTARFCGMAIPARNWTTLMNWREKNNSTGDVITHKWGEESKNYIENLITTLQAGDDAKSESVSTLASRLQSNYISAVFGANPSIVLKQLGSIPLAGAYLDARNMPTPAQISKIDRGLISKYTQELEWRTMGYATPETKQLKDNPNWTQTNKVFKFVFGGGAITAMDGWAASALWPWAENKVRREHPELTVGTKAQIDAGESAFYKKVAEEFENAISRSQSVSDEIHQGTLRKSKNPITKAFTMFRSDSAQTYNALRQKIGEARYYMRTGAKEKVIQTAKKAAGTAFVAMLLNAAWSEAISFLMALWKNKGKYYRDDEDELTAESVIGEMGRNVMESIMGTVTFGDEIAQLIGNTITGDRRYDLEAPGLEQINEIFNLVQDMLQGNFGRISEAADVVKNGGNLGEYLSDNSGEILGEIKDTATKVATYFGLPVNNVEAYLLGALKWVSPELGTAYDDLFQNIGKSDLTGMEGSALEGRVGRILSDKNISESDSTAAALAALYEAGYKAAIPSDTPTSVSIDGEKHALGDYQQQAYDTIWGGIVADALDDMVASDSFKEADPKTQAKMLSNLYTYAAEQAKAELFDEYELDSGAEKNAAIVAAGATVAECITWNTITSEMKSGEKSAELVSWDIPEEAKREIFRSKISDSREDSIAAFDEAGLSFDQFLQAYSMYGQINNEDLKAGMKAVEFSHWVNAQGYTAEQAAVVKDELTYFNMTPANSTRYDELVGAGMDPDEAYNLTGALNELKPEDGEEKVSDLQKWRASVDFSDDVDDQLAALSAVMTDAQFLKVEIANNFGVSPDVYVTLQEIKPRYDADGNGSYKNEEIQAAIDGMTGYYSTEQKAVLWQLATGSTSSRNNPYSRQVGQKVLDARAAAKEAAAQEQIEAPTDSADDDSFSQALLNQLLGRG